MKVWRERLLREGFHLIPIGHEGFQLIPMTRVTHHVMRFSVEAQVRINRSSAAGSSSSSMTNSAIPSPPVPQPQPSSTPTASSVVVRGRNRELQLLNNEMQLLQEELISLDNVPPASQACKDFVAFVESREDSFFPNSDGVAPQAWPYDRPVKAARCCWKF